MLVKFTAYFLTNSNAILTDALETIINISTSIFALYSIYLSAKPKDKDHPYGHGKIEFFSSGFEGFLITFTGLAMIAKAIYSFFHPHELANFEIGILITAGAGMVNFFMGRMLVKHGKRLNSIVLIADGKHLLTDTISSVGLVLGLIIIWATGLYWLDNVLTIILGILIMYTGFQLLRNAYGGLMDEADEEMLKNISNVLNENRKEKWIDIHNLRILRFGSKLHVDCHITMPYYDDLKTIHHEIDELESIVSGKISEDVELFVHAEPCSENSCPHCLIKDCPVRKHKFEKKIEWGSENLTQLNKHKL
ncbi:MAG: cation transporter [Chitinophagaceae bacterium]|nr:MAG: cation transporter [Chitinophagaceae bacterium]